MSEEIIEKKGDLDRIPLYIEGLDDNMEGGVPTGSVNLITGMAGTMKSSITFNILYNEVLKGKVGLYICLEQSYASLLNHMINMGYDFSDVEVMVIGSDINRMKKKIEEIKSSKKGTLIISDLAAIRKETKAEGSINWWNIIRTILAELNKASSCDLFVLDSLNALYVLTDFKEPRGELFHIFNFFRELNMTSYLISEMPVDRSRYCEYGVEDFLADGVIVLQLIERYRKVTREINVVKMRATNASVDVYSLEYKNGKFKALYGGQPPLV